MKYCFENVQSSESTTVNFSEVLPKGTEPSEYAFVFDVTARCVSGSSVVRSDKKFTISKSRNIEVNSYTDNGVEISETPGDEGVIINISHEFEEPAAIEVVVKSRFLR